MTTRRYSQHDLIGALQMLAQRLARAPIMADLWDRDDLPSTSAYQCRFGGWNAALREAGLTRRHPMKRRSGGCDDDAGSRADE